jgi:hypothetical protein
MKRLLLNLTTASVLVASTGVSMAQTTPMPTAPTTKILAIGTFPPGTDMQLAQHILPTEVRETAQLYLEGKIDQWYSLQDRAGVALAETRYRTIDVGGLEIFYRETGPATAPVVLLLHGFPRSSRMFLDLIPMLAEVAGEAEAALSAKNENAKFS